MLALKWPRGSRLLRLLEAPEPAVLAGLTWASIALNIGLASLLAAPADREVTPLFRPAVVAVLEGVAVRIAGHFGVVTAVDPSLFWQVWLFLSKHPPLDVGEYYEAGITSLAVLLGRRAGLAAASRSPSENKLGATSLLELGRTGKHVLREKRRAAIGHLSSAIAHQSRNRVARIASSITTAKQLSRAEREEMFEIASVEANRLSQLTTEFLNCARPRPWRLQEQGRDLLLAANRTGRVRFPLMLPGFWATPKQQGNP